MVLGGLWHGAGYNFLLWGLYHGMLLILERVWREAFPQRALRAGRWKVALQILGTFHLILFGWLLFRVESVAHLGRLLHSLLHRWDYWQSAGEIALYMAPVVLPLVLYELWQVLSGKLEVVPSAWLPVRAAFLGFTLAAVLLLNRSGNLPFIYFQF